MTKSIYDTTLHVEIDNDGEYFIDSDMLADVSAENYMITLLNENSKYFDPNGMDPRSIIKARVINTVPIKLR